jgi:hypothetical protein
VLFCVMCVICLLCLIVLPLPPGKNPFAVKTNNNNNYLESFSSCFTRLETKLNVRTLLLH